MSAALISSALASPFSLTFLRLWELQQPVPRLPLSRFTVTSQPLHQTREFRLEV